MRVPTRYEEITVSQWMKSMVTLKDDDLSEIDKNIHLISLYTGMSLQDVDVMDIRKYAELSGKLSFLKSELREMPINESYKGLAPTLSLTKMNVAQMVDYESILKAHNRNIYECADELLSVVYAEQGKEYDPGKHEQHTKMFADAKLTEVIGVVFFYSVYWQSAEKIIQVCIAKANRTIAERMKEIKENKRLIHS